MAYDGFYSHVNYSVTKIKTPADAKSLMFYSHVNYSVTKIIAFYGFNAWRFTVT